MVKEITKAILILFISLSIGFGLGFLFLEKRDSNPSLDKFPEEIIKPDEQKIDSLTKEIKVREELIDQLKDSINNIKIIKIYKIDSIRNLPTTEAVDFLKIKLREFESKYQ